MNFTGFSEITNFREICMGEIRSGTLYRGSYPVFKIDEERDKIYTKLVLDAKIGCVLNLASNNDGLKRLANLVPWYNNLLKNNNVIGLDIQFEFDFTDEFGYDVFNYRLRQGFKFLIEHNGPYLVHCNAGIDRTGFFAAITELLFGAGIDDVIYDYLLSYGKEFADDNNSELNINTGKVILEQLNSITNGKINDKDNLQLYMEKYFLEKIGLTNIELETLKRRLSK